MCKSCWVNRLRKGLPECTEMSNEKDNPQGLHIGLVSVRLSFLFVIFMFFVFFFCYFLFFQNFDLDKRGFEAECGRVYRWGGGVIEKANTKVCRWGSLPMGCVMLVLWR